MFQLKILPFCINIQPICMYSILDAAHAHAASPRITFQKSTLVRIAPAEQAAAASAVTSPFGTEADSWAHSRALRELPSQKSASRSAGLLLIQRGRIANRTAISSTPNQN
ncbi:MAG: hypothetical protein P8Y63_14795 [Deltaproteobacteria bacterium]|jgi:hypothetical protein